MQGKVTFFGSCLFFVLHFYFYYVVKEKDEVIANLERELEEMKRELEETCKVSSMRTEISWHVEQMQGKIMVFCSCLFFVHFYYVVN